VCVWADCDVDCTVNSPAVGVNVQHSTHASPHVSVNDADSCSRTCTSRSISQTSTSRSMSQTLPSFKRWRQMRRRLTDCDTSAAQSGSVSAARDSVRRRCDETLSHDKSVRCESDLNKREQRSDDHTQLLSNHLCVNCQQLMVNFYTLSENVIQFFVPLSCARM